MNKTQTETRADSFIQGKQKIALNGILTLNRYNISSTFLNRIVKVDLFMVSEPGAGPAFHGKENYPRPALLLNDGQDMEQLKLVETASSLRENGLIPDMFIIAVHANENRHEEYGTASYLDYKNRGKKAAAYSCFIIKELIPYLREQAYMFMDPEQSAIAGFSLGGLSALDIAWANPGVFSKAGVFSGSLWWRYKKAEGGGEQAHRIMHHIIRNSEKREGFQFWFEAGTKDESHDRNNSGTIDAIEDTEDLIRALKETGYNDEDIMYRLVKGGEHNYNTWAKVFPEFLIWAFGQP